MSLPNDLISQFAKLSNGQNKTSNESTVYGTTVVYGGKTYVNIDGSDSITPVVTTSEVKAGERVTVMIKDHTATIIGNISNPSASTESVGKVLDEYDIIVAKIGNFELLIADKVTTEQLQAQVAIIEEAIISKASIAELNAVKATIKDLDVSLLQADIARIDKAVINKAEITDLDAIHAHIDLLEADVGEITTLIGGQLTMDNIQSLVLTSSKVTVDNAFIKDAMIDRMSASKLTAGVVNTNLVNLESEDGSMSIKGSLQQFKDANGNVRIQIGKDASGDFTFALYGADGQGQLINQNGITASAISDGLIVNDMVADNAAIAGSKLNINSVVEEINDGSTFIKGTKVIVDEGEQTLDVAFNAMTNIIDDMSESITTNTTSIKTAQGEIEVLISNTTMEKEDGSTVSLKDAYSEMERSLDSVSSKLGTLETTYADDIKTVNSKVSTFQQTLDSFNTKIQESETITNNLAATVDKTLKRVDTKYYLSTSPVKQEGGSWIDDRPDSVDGKYLWMKDVYTYADDSTSESDPMCLTSGSGYTILLSEETFIVQCDADGNPL